MGCNVTKDVKVEENAGGDTTEMSEEQAAEKIQASFRGYKTRKILKDNGVLPDKQQQSSSEDPPPVVKQKVNDVKNSALSTEEEIVDIDLNDADVAKAALKIQASYRNFSKKKKQIEEVASIPETITKKEEEENLEDIDLEDPDVEKAALKIQSTFRGYKVRKEVNTESTPLTNGEKE